VAWGITGSGDRIREVLDVMIEIQNRYRGVEIIVYVSIAGDQVLKWYRLSKVLQTQFKKVLVEINANAPFLAGDVQTKRFDFLLLAPVTSNTVAKISLGIGDTMLTNAAAMGLKALVPLYLLPSDFKEGTVYTTLPNGKALKLRIRSEDVAHVKTLAAIRGVHVITAPEQLRTVFEERFGPQGDADPPPKTDK
jgi:archaeoflavoprotein AfpA